MTPRMSRPEFTRGQAMTCKACGSQNAYMLRWLGVTSVRCPDCGADLFPGHDPHVVEASQERYVLSAPRIDPIDIKIAVRSGQLKFYYGTHSKLYCKDTTNGDTVEITINEGGTGV